MKILVIGSGGREHALCWKIAQSKKVSKIYCAPGNAGTGEIAENIDIKADDINALLAFAKREHIALTCVGPEIPLVLGIVDIFDANGLKIFGPRKETALLEGSKIYAKEVMKKYGIPTADFKVFQDAGKAKAYVKQKGAPLVVKADGLAAGKGVTVCRTIGEAEKAINDAMVNKVFGDAGLKIMIEDTLVGEEASIIIVSDGKDSVTLDSSQDHKRIFEHDMGPNTGGMGAYSPAPVITEELVRRITEEVVDPLINGMRRDGSPFKGVLYTGIMVTDSGPKVLEFNVRLGDPETQTLLPRMKGDLVELMEWSISGALEKKEIAWDARPCVCIVLASGGYPGSYEKGKVIRGLEWFIDKKDRFVFHAGTIKQGELVLSNGGRVLGVVGLGDTVKDAVDKAYEACQKITFEKKYFRKDIGYKVIQQSTIVTNRSPGVSGKAG